MSTSTPPPAPPAPPRPVGASFFAWIRSLGVTRRDDAWIAGVCSGISARTGLDVRLVRGIAIVIAILGGPVFLAYAVGWALLPDSRGHIHAESAVHGHFTYPMIFIGLAAVLTFLPFTRGIWFDGAPHIWGMPDWLEVTLRTLWVLALIAGAIWLTVLIARSIPRQPGTGQPSAGQPGAGQPGAGRADAGGTAGDSGAPAPGYPASASGPVAFAAAGASYAGASTAAGAPGADAAAPAAGSADATTSTSETPTASPDDATVPTPEAATAAPPASPWTHTGSTDHGWSRERHEQAREAARARAAAWKAAHPNRGAGAAFSSIVLGIALVAAAMVGIGYGAVVPDGKLVLVISIAALVVIAVGIVIAGIRGRTSGGLGPFAFLLAIVVLFTGVLPAGTEVQPFGTQNVDAGQALSSGPDSYLLIAGKTVVDAEDLTNRSPDGTVDVWLGAGQTEVVLPEGVPVVVESHVFAGTVTSTLGTERSGILIDDDRFFPASGSSTGIPAGSDPDRVSAARAAGIPVIRLWLLAGTVTLVPENER